MKTFVAIALAGTLAGAPSVAGAQPAAPEHEAPAVDADDSGADADNTGRNVRDRSGDQPTPIDQGEGETDLRITQQIRQSLMASDDLSLNAKNVKVITQDGAVTLRGPVETPDEKQRIGALAQATAGVVRVRNDLEVTGDR